MRAHQIMTRNVITVGPETLIVDAANTMLKQHISGLPVTDGDGRLVGIVSQGDFLRRAELGTERKRSRWLGLLFGAGREASDFIREQGRKVGDVMTPSPSTVAEDATLEDIVALMEKKDIKRLPVVRDERLVGIVTRTNLLQAVADLAREIPDPTADDDQIRDRIIAVLEKNEWCPFGLNVIVRDGVVHLSGVITDDRARQAAVIAAENVAGVKTVHDRLCWIDPMSGMYLNSPEDEGKVKPT